MLDDLSSHSTDGRMIKNAVRTAFALAIDANEPMGPSHLRLAVEAASQFEADIQAEAKALDEVGHANTADTSTPRKRKRVD